MRRRAATALLVLGILLAWAYAPGMIPGAYAQAPVEIFLTEFTYDEPSGMYAVVLSITDPSRVESIDPRLLDLQTGENIRFGNLVPVYEREMSFKLPTDQLQPGKKYRLAIRAFEKGTTTYLRRPSQNPSEDPLVFASQEFAYNPPQLAPIAWALDGVSADFPNHALLIALHHSDTSKALRYEAVVVDKRGGAVGRIDRSPLNLNNGLVEAPLPATMENVDQPAEYHLTVRLYTADNKLVGEQRKDFTLPAPPVPSIVERVRLALETFPWLRWSLLGIGASLLLAYLIHTFVPRKRKPLPRPQNLQPVYIQTAASPGPRPPRAEPAAAADPRPAPPPVAVPNGAGAPAQPVAAPPAVSAAPAAIPADAPAMLIVSSGSEAGRHYLLADGELTIGTVEGNDIVIDDAFASRRHARIVRDNDAYVWSDRERVTNSTHINGQAVSGPQPLRDGDEIEVGRTILVFRWPQSTQAAVPAQGAMRLA